MEPKTHVRSLHRGLGKVRLRLETYHTALRRLLRATASSLSSIMVMDAISKVCDAIIMNTLERTGAMSGEMCCSVEASSSSLRVATGCEGYVGEMGSGGKPPSPSSTGSCQCSCSCSCEVGKRSSAGCLVTRSQSEFRALNLGLRPSIQMRIDWPR